MLNNALHIAVIILFTLFGFASGEERFDWPRWRGPDDTGSTQYGRFPAKFDASNHLWKAELPGKGCSTPIVFGERIFVTSAAGNLDSLLCFDLQGTEKWRATFGNENPGKHKNGSGSNASPVTDGKLIFVYFKSGTLAAIELNGTVRWKSNLVERFGKDTLFWDHGTSPVLTDRHVIMARMHQGESWVAAFDKDSGQIAWKVPRNYTTPTECDHGYSTPLVLQHADKESVLVWGAEHITIHDVATGAVTWSCGNFNPGKNKLWPAIATPVIVKDMVVIAYGRNDRGLPKLHGVRLNGNGDVTQTNHVWKREDVGTFVPTPVVMGNQVILVRDRGEVESIDPATGNTNWKGEFPKSRSNFYSSPLVAGGVLYAPREDGVVFVARVSGNSLELLAENDMGESVIGSPIPCGDRLLIRGEKHLFCIAAPQK